MAVIRGFGRIVDRLHHHRDGAGRGLSARIGHDHFKGVGAVPVFVGHVFVAAIGLDRDRAVRGRCAFGIGQRVAIGVGAHDRAGDRRVFRGLVSIVRRFRCIVDRRHRHIDRNS